MKHIIAVMSGKGGVGKSTVAVNLAIALAQQNAKVALIDADFYGPSIPTLLGGGNLQPDHEDRLIPPEKFGVKYVSIGFFLQNPDDPIIWRGPMFNKALSQLFNDISWGEVDYCIVDMPPGTGDSALSLTQLVKLSGALVVTTPQEVAMADVRKCINMLAKVNVPVLGIVENMSGFKTPDGKIYPIFGEGGGQQIADKYSTPLLASIPIELEIRSGGDLANPVASQSQSQSHKYFNDLAKDVIHLIDNQATPLAGLKIVN